MRTVQSALAAFTMLALSGTALAQQPAPATGDLTIAFAAEATTLDPAKYAAGVDTYFIGQMFEQLVRPGPDLQPQNWLAESWEVVEEDGKTHLDIRIRQDVKFHNGDPLTSGDFEFSYERLRDPAVSRWSHLQNAVERFEIVDDHHFKVHFSEPDASYVAGYLQLWAMPKDYFEQVGDEGFAQNPVGTGPWKFVSWAVKEELKLEAFDDYWNAEARPGVKNLTVKIIPEDITRVAAFRTGEVDWIDAVPPAMIPELQALDDVEMTSRVSGNNLFILFPEHRPDSPFADRRVRQAVAHAIDFDAIITSVLFGQGERYTQIGEGTFGYDPALEPYAFDPQRARELLAEAGYPNGFDTPCYNLTTPREPNVKEMGEAMFAYMAAAGIRCRVQGLEYGAWITLGRRGGDSSDLDGPISWMWGQGVPGDPGTPWAGHVHTYVPDEGWGSYSYSSDPEVDAMIKESNLLMEPSEREAKLQEIARLKHERVLGGVTTYRPLVTFAWRGDKVEFTPWGWPGFWRSLQEIGLKQ